MKDDLTHTIIGFAYKVHNVLGPGFLESVYENALRIELERAGVAVRQQEKLKVWYEDHVVAITTQISGFLIDSSLR